MTPPRSPSPRTARRSPPAAPNPFTLPEVPAWAVPVIVALGILVPVLMLLKAVTSRIPLSFPLDDAWIHLQYARNLAEHGAFTYFPGDHSTAGSTAPLFTLLETLLWFVSRNEIFTGLALGLAGWIAFLFVFARWASRRLGAPGWVAFAVGMVILDGRMGLLAVSGMETSLFLLGLALAFLAWSRDDALGAGLALGATVWVRPEALVLAGVFAIDGGLARRTPRRAVAGIVALIALVGAYLGFNFVTGHTAFPNTLAAKSAYYGGIPLGQFLRSDVLTTFSAGWMVLLPFAAIAAGLELRRRLSHARREGEPSMLVELGWAIALVLAYAVVLRFSHRFNRYLVPALPALAIAGTMGLRDVARWGRANATRIGPGIGIALVALSIAGGLQLSSWVPDLATYGAFSRYHLNRQVRTGQWLAEHTPADAVVATHDVGAVAFYSRRRVVDLVGLITPEVVPHLNRPDYVTWLTGFLDRKNVGYLAVLDTWQMVDNEAPLFIADPSPELMRVYAWHPGVTHLVPTQVAFAADAAGAALQRGDLEMARREAAHALQADSGSAVVWTLNGAVADRQGRYPDAVRAYERATALFPGSPEAHTGYAVALTRVGRLDEARAQLDTLRALGGRKDAIGLVQGMIDEAAKAEK